MGGESAKQILEPEVAYVVCHVICPAYIFVVSSLLVAVRAHAFEELL